MNCEAENKRTKGFLVLNKQTSWCDTATAYNNYRLCPPKMCPAKLHSVTRWKDSRPCNHTLHGTAMPAILLGGSNRIELLRTNSFTRTPCRFYTAKKLKTKSGGSRTLPTALGYLCSRMISPLPTSVEQQEEYKVMLYLLYLQKAYGNVTFLHGKRSMLPCAISWAKLCMVRFITIINNLFDSSDLIKLSGMRYR